jgi:hypothetical protein
MTVLPDTNVVPDILLDRQPWYNEAALILVFRKKSLSPVLSPQHQ